MSAPGLDSQHATEHSRGGADVSAGADGRLILSSVAKQRRKAQHREGPLVGPIPLPVDVATDVADALVGQAQVVTGAANDLGQSFAQHSLFAVEAAWFSADRQAAYPRQDRQSEGAAAARASDGDHRRRFT